MNCKKNTAILIYDDNSSDIGINFLSRLCDVLNNDGLKSQIINLKKSEHGTGVIDAFDNIANNICPEYLVVLDCACIKMKSTEEDPLYHNWVSKVIHILLRHPWEYELLFEARINFTTSIFCCCNSDVEYINSYYPNAINTFDLSSICTEIQHIPSCNYDSIDQLISHVQAQPAYLQKLATDWLDLILCDSKIPMHVHLETLLHNMNFSFTSDEFIDIIKMLHPVPSIADFQLRNIFSYKFNHMSFDNLFKGIANEIITFSDKRISLLNHLY